MCKRTSTHISHIHKYKHTKQRHTDLLGYPYNIDLEIRSIKKMLSIKNIKSNHLLPQWWSGQHTCWFCQQSSARSHCPQTAGRIWRQSSELISAFTPGLWNTWAYICVPVSPQAVCFCSCWVRQTPPLLPAWPCPLRLAPRTFTCVAPVDSCWL